MLNNHRIVKTGVYALVFSLVLMGIAAFCCGCASESIRCKAASEDASLYQEFPEVHHWWK